MLGLRQKRAGGSSRQYQLFGFILQLSQRTPMENRIAFTLLIAICFLPKKFDQVQAQVSECSAYTTINDPTRKDTHASSPPYGCDNSLVTKWYRFITPGSAMMPETCVPYRYCGTNHGGWLSGQHPSVSQGIVVRYVCYSHGPGKCCEHSDDIRVRNCGLFYVYELKAPPSCYMRYCTTTTECTVGGHNCDRNAVCTNKVGSSNSSSCKCNNGYSGNGTYCSDIDECTVGVHNCDRNAVCTNKVGSSSCKCNNGYPGNGTSCSDIDECAAGGHSCDRNAICTNNIGSFSCACKNGYSGTGTFCSDMDECHILMCKNSGKCIDGIYSYTCRCTSDYTGRRCETRISRPCDSSPCQNGALCRQIDKIQTYKCSCSKGYGGSLCEFYYGNSAVSVIIQEKINKPFNGTLFKVGVARALNNYCQQNPTLCPRKTVISRSKRDTTSLLHVFKPDDVYFLPGYPKYGMNGTVEARFFVGIRQSRSSESGTNTTDSPFAGQPLVFKVNTVVKAVQASTDVFQQQFGIEIESVKIVQIRDAKRPKEKSNNTVLIIIVCISLVAVIGLIVLVTICIRRRRKRYACEIEHSIDVTGMVRYSNNGDTSMEDNRNIELRISTEEHTNENVGTITNQSHGV